jgi:hypothetical protein
LDGEKLLHDHQFFITTRDISPDGEPLLTQYGDGYWLGLTHNAFHVIMRILIPRFLRYIMPATASSTS